MDEAIGLWLDYLMTAFSLVASKKYAGLGMLKGMMGKLARAC